MSGASKSTESGDPFWISGYFLIGFLLMMFGIIVFFEDRSISIIMFVLSFVFYSVALREQIRNLGHRIGRSTSRIRSFKRSKPGADEVLESADPQHC